MATETKPQKTEQAKPREARPEREQRPAGPDEAKEGVPGYGQPPEEVRKPLPEQKW